MNIENERNDSLCVNEDPASYGEKHRTKSRTIDFDDVGWILQDKDHDDEALLKLIAFLDSRGLRKNSSVCQSAILAIESLTQEVLSLRDQLSKKAVSNG